MIVNPNLGSAIIMYKREIKSLEKLGHKDMPYFKIYCSLYGNIGSKGERGLGKILMTYYNTYETVENLVSQGNLNNIKENGTPYHYATDKYGEIYAKNAPIYHRIPYGEFNYNYIFVDKIWYVKYKKSTYSGFIWANSGDWVNLNRFFKEGQDHHTTGFKQGGNPYHKMNIGQERDRILVI